MKKNKAKHCLNESRLAFNLLPDVDPKRFSPSFESLCCIHFEALSDCWGVVRDGGTQEQVGEFLNCTK